MNKFLPLVIINPASGSGSAGRDWGSASTIMRSHFGPFENRFTRSRGDAARIAEEEARAGRDLIISFGGDGTISEIAGGIVNSEMDCELGVLPHGTGADFLRTLKFPKNLTNAARALRNGQSSIIDMGQVEYCKPEGGFASRFYINSASFGLSGVVASQVNNQKKILGGTFSFAVGTVRAAMLFNNPRISLEMDGQRWISSVITTVCFNNGRYFGGGMKIAPRASPVDGRLDAVIVKKVSFLKLLTHAPLLYWGAHLGLSVVHSKQIISARAWPVDTDRKVIVEIDGETPGELPAEFKICPAALKVRTSRCL